MTSPHYRDEHSIDVDRDGDGVRVTLAGGGLEVAATLTDSEANALAAALTDAVDQSRVVDD